MRTSKKLVLASLVGLMMAVSFAMGLLPSQDISAVNRAKAAAGVSDIAITVDGVGPLNGTYSIPVGAEQGFSVLSTAKGADAVLLPTGQVQWSLATDGAGVLAAAPGDYVATVTARAPGEAGLYVSTANGLACVANLVFYDLKAAGAEGKALDSVSVTAPIDASRILVDADATLVPFTLTASTNSAFDTLSVSYFLYPESPGGAEYGTAVDPPYAVTIPDLMALADLYSMKQACETYAVYAEATDGARKVQVEDISVFDVCLVDADTDDNLLPDDPLGLALADSDMWRAAGQYTVDKNGIPAMLGLPELAKQAATYYVQVAMKSFAAADKLYINDADVGIVLQDPDNPARIVQVSAPRALVDTAGGEEGFLLVAIADSQYHFSLINSGMVPDSLPDTALIGNGFFVEVSVLVSGPKQTYEEIDPARLEANPILLIMQGLQVAEGQYNVFESYSTDVSAAPMNITAPAGQPWSQITATVHDGEMSANLTSLSIVAPFEAAPLPTPEVVDVLTSTFDMNLDYAIGGAILEVEIQDLPPTGVTTTITIDGMDVPITGSSNPRPRITTLSGVVPRANDLATPATDAVVPLVVQVDSPKHKAPLMTFNGTFTYVGSVGVVVTPNQGLEAGATPITVTGEGFDVAGMTASFTDGAAVAIDNIVVGDSTSFTGRTRPHAAGIVDITVTTANNFVGFTADAYTYIVYPGATPILTDVIPVNALDDGNYLVRLFGKNLSQDADPSYVDLFCYFTTAKGEVQAQIVPGSTFDDSSVDVLTPVHDPGACQVFVRKEAHTKQGPVTQDSNKLDFTFVDKAGTGMTITDVDPPSDPLSGGNAVTITGTGFPEAISVDEITTGTVLRVGQTVGLFHAAAGAANVEIPVYLFREDPNAKALFTHQAPASMSFTIKVDTSVLIPKSPFFKEVKEISLPPIGNFSYLNVWYGKTPSASNPNPDEIKVVISGGTQNVETPDPSSTEITTKDNQRDGASNEIRNPFLLGVLVFDVVPTTKTGETTFIRVTSPVMADRNADSVPDVSGQNAFFNVGDSQEDPPPVPPPVVLFGLRAAAVSASTSTTVDVTAPAGEAPGAVDVRVQDAADPTKFAVWRANVPAEGGYEYTADGAPYMTDLQPNRAWLFGGLMVHITGQNFTDTTQVFFDGTPAQMVDLLGAAAKIYDANNIYVIAPPLTTTSTDAEIPVSIQLTDTGNEQSIREHAFTYVRYETRTESVKQATADITTTAFFFAGSSATGDIPLVLPGTADLAYVQVPALDNGLDTVFGLAQTTKAPELVGTDLIATGAPLADSWNVDLHLYDSAFEQAGNSVTFPEISVKTNTGVTKAAIELQDTPILLTVPTGDTALTVADVQTGAVSTFSIDTTLTDGPNGLDPDLMVFDILPGTENYQSTIGPAEFQSTGDQVTSVTSRLYHLTAYALRTGAPPPYSVLLSIDPTEGNVGDPFTLHGSGFNWATGVQFGDVFIPASELTIVNDFTITGTIPAPSKAGLTVSVTIVLPGGLILGPVTFTYGDVFEPPIVVSATPDQAWVFGGVVAHISGANFVTDKQGTTQVYFGATLAQPAPGYLQDENNLNVLVPPFAGDVPGATTTVAVRAVNPDSQEATAPEPFTYVRYVTETETIGAATGEVTTTAFFFDGSAGDGSGDQTLVLHGTANTATVAIPQLYGSPKQTENDVFVLARMTKIPGLAGTNTIAAGSALADSWNADIHLYEGLFDESGGGWPEISLKANTPPLPTKVIEINEPLVLTVPTDDTALSTADVLAGTVSTFSVDTDLQGGPIGLEVGDVASFALGPDGVQYESTVGPAEYQNTGAQVTSVTSRLYHATSYALRTGVGSQLAGLHLIVPDHGPTVGGTTVTIYGQGLNWTTGVTFDGNPATNLTVLDDFHIQVDTPPASAAGIVPVEVTVAGVGVLGGLTYEYRECLPTEIDDVDPTTGPAIGGTLVTITGANFGSQPTVAFGGKDGVVQTSTDDTITVLTPGAPAEVPAGGLAVEVTVTNECGTTTASQEFTYTQAQAVVTGIDPDNGPVSGGTTVVITGENLAPAALGLKVDITRGYTRVFFGGVQALITGFNTDSLTVVTPPYPTPDLVDVTVETNGGDDALSPRMFQYTDESVLCIAQIDPDEAWVIGGIVAEIRGSSLNTAGASVTIEVPASDCLPGGATLPLVFDAAPTTAAALVRIPPLEGVVGDQQYFIGEVVATVDGGKCTCGTVNFTYKHYELNDDETVVTTAFSLGANADTTTVTRDIFLDLQGNVPPVECGPTTPALKASITFPPKPGNSDTYMLVAAARSNAAGDPLGAQANIQPAEAPNPIPGTWDFDMHQYKSTPEVKAAIRALYGEIALTDYSNPLYNPTVRFPNDAAGLTRTQITGVGVSLWSVLSALDYTDFAASNVVTPDADNGRYEWTMNAGDILAPAAGDPVTQAKVNVLELGGVFSLRPVAAPERVQFKRYPTAGELAPGEQLITEACVCRPVQVIIVGAGLAQTESITFAGFAGTGLQATDDKIKVMSPQVAEDDWTQIFGGRRVLGKNVGMWRYRAKVDLVVNLPGGATVGDPLDFTFYRPITFKPLGLLTGLGDLFQGVPGIGKALLGLLSLLGLGAGGAAAALPLLALPLLGGMGGGGGGGGGGGPCFIATAAYGTPMADQIDVLRAMRDTYLLDNAAGAALVDLYYRISPAIATVVAKSPFLAAAVRTLLIPIIALSKLALAMPSATLMLLVASAAGLVYRRHARRRKA